MRPRVLPLNLFPKVKGQIGLVQKNGVTLFLGNKTFVDSQLQLVEGWGRSNPFHQSLWNSST